jgi:hypothetical protein
LLIRLPETLVSSFITSVSSLIRYAWKVEEPTPLRFY